MRTKNIKGSLFLIISIVFCSCTNEIRHSDYKDFSDGWKSSDSATFTFNEIPDSKGDILINIRNNNNYPFSNIFLISSLLKNGVEITTDTLEYSMADKRGRFLGKGFGNVKESLLIWKEEITFSSESKYSVILKHAMRKNQNEFGMKVLPGIISVGISIILNKENDE